MGAKELGLFFKERRLELGLSREEVGVRAGLAGKTIGYIENATRITKIATIHAVADALEVDRAIAINILNGSESGGYPSPEEAARAIEQYSREEKKRFFDLIGLGVLGKYFDRESD